MTLTSEGMSRSMSEEQSDTATYTDDPPSWSKSIGVTSRP